MRSARISRAVGSCTSSCYRKFFIQLTKHIVGFEVLRRLVEIFLTPMRSLDSKFYQRKGHKTGGFCTCYVGRLCVGACACCVFKFRRKTFGKQDTVVTSFLFVFNITGLYLVST